ncbi:hypothetical protein WME89_02175 [Sorangium sp. So ce321]|uniref:hypothetical protein n=1 Tax=Sorangium sp. So ce321 TaxID=3133300 RepID=UPI003F5E07B4
MTKILKAAVAGGAAAVAAAALLWGMRPAPSAPTQPRERGAATEHGAAPSAMAGPPTATAKAPPEPEAPPATEATAGGALARPQRPGPSGGPAPVDEPSLMARLRALGDSDPALALELARQGNQLFPGSSDAAERAAVAVKSLVLQGQMAEARSEAQAMVDRYPHTRWALSIQRHMNVRPSRN